MASVKMFTGFLAAVAFLAGFLMMDRSSVSGNAIISSGAGVSAASITGLVLVFISIALAAYSIKK